MLGYHEWKGCSNCAHSDRVHWRRRTTYEELEDDAVVILPRSLASKMRLRLLLDLVYKANRQSSFHCAMPNLVNNVILDNVRRVLSAVGVAVILISPAGETCGPLRKLSELRKYVQFENYRGVEGPAKSASCLSCSFDDAGSTCCWYDDPNAPLHWQRTRFKQKVTPHQMRQVTGRSELPNGEFLATGSETARPPSDSANLIAEVPCLDDNAKLSLKYWKSSDKPKLQVCTECANRSPDCVEAPRSRIAPHPVEFAVGCKGESKGPAKIIIKASEFTQSDVVAIDDIVFNGQLCQNEPGAAGGATKVLQNGCSSLTCDFEKGNTCDWGPGRPENGQWNVNSGREGSPATGIFGDAGGSKEGKYAFVGRTTPNVASSTSEGSTVYVLQSPRFKTKSPAKLKYRVYDQSVGPVFEVCTDAGLTDCKNRVDKPLSPTGDNRWQDEQSIDLEPNKPYTLSYVVKNLKTNYYIGLDDVKLEPQNGDNTACVAA